MLYQLVFSAAERLIVSLKLMVILVISHNDLNWDDFLNPLTPKSDQHLISPYNITLYSNINVMRIEEMITN